MSSYLTIAKQMIANHMPAVTGAIYSSKSLSYNAKLRTDEVLTQHCLIVRQ